MRDKKVVRLIGLIFTLLLCISMISCTFAHHRRYEIAEKKNFDRKDNKIKLCENIKLYFDLFVAAIPLKDKIIHHRHIVKALSDSQYCAIFAFSNKGTAPIECKINRAVLYLDNYDSIIVPIQPDEDSFLLPSKETEYVFYSKKEKHSTFRRGVAPLIREEGHISNTAYEYYSDSNGFTIPHGQKIDSINVNIDFIKENEECNFDGTLRLKFKESKSLATLLSVG